MLRRGDAALESSGLATPERLRGYYRDMVTIRAEERLALEVSRPEALIYGDFEELVTG